MSVPSAAVRVGRPWGAPAGGLTVVVGAGALLVVATEALSLGHALTTRAVAGLWSAGAVAAGVYGWRRRAALSLPSLPAGVVDRGLLGGVAFLVLLLGLTALATPPNTWDALAYHMPRVARWAQEASVRHYYTTIPRQLYQPPGASFAVLHAYLLAGGDRLTNLVQWASMLGSLVGVGVLARALGGGARATMLAVVVAATIPIGVLESTTAQNDYVEALWLVCLAAFVVLRRPPVAVGLALGLALLTKGTGYVFAAPLMAWWCADAVVRTRGRAVRAILVVTLAVLALNAGHYVRNMAWYGAGAPLGPGRDGPFVYANERHGVLATLSVATRNLALQLATPWAPVNRSVTHAVERMHEWAGLDVNDPATTWYGSRFVVGRFHPDENLASNGAHLLLVAGSFAAVLARRRPARPAIYVLAIVAGFLTFCAVFRWQPWHTRLELPLFVLAAPVVGLVLARRPLLGPLVGLGVLVFAVLTIALADTRPLLGARSVLRVDRTTQMFVARPDLKSGYLRMADRVERLRCRRLAVWSAGNGLEYPLWALTGAPRSPVHLEHVDAAHPAPGACAVFVEAPNDATDRIVIGGEAFGRQERGDSVSLYARDEEASGEAARVK